MISTAGHVFLLFGRWGSGKTTLSKKLLKIFEKDYEIEILDVDKVIHQIGGREFRKKDVIGFMEKIVDLAEISAKKNKIVIVAMVAPKKKFRDIPREVFGSKYHEIYLRCSIRNCVDRRHKNKLKKVLRFYGHIRENFESPKNPDIIIDTDKQTLEESVNIAEDFIRITINENNN